VVSRRRLLFPPRAKKSRSLSLAPAANAWLRSVTTVLGRVVHFCAGDQDAESRAVPAGSAKRPAFLHPVPASASFGKSLAFFHLALRMASFGNGRFGRFVHFCASRSGFERCSRLCILVQWARRVVGASVGMRLGTMSRLRTAWKTCRPGSGCILPRCATVLSTR